MTARMISAININFDSISESLNFDRSFRDPCFDRVIDRFFRIAEKRGFRYSIYVVGRDLENPEVAARVREWASAGHEIGNHSWSHDMGLGARAPQQIYQEVASAHERIVRCTGREPHGFIAPAWNSSRALFEVLSGLNYLYDTSVFASPILGAVALKVFLNQPLSRRTRAILRRTDWLQSLWCSDREHFHRTDRGERKGVWEFPLPIGPWKFPVWHTIGYMFGWRVHQHLLESCLAAPRRWFYYVCHPVDLLAPDELPAERGNRLARTSVPLEEKVAVFERCVDLIQAKSERVCTVSELVQAIIAPRSNEGSLQQCG